MQKLNLWLQDPINLLIYRSNLKYIPTEANMALIILAAIMKNDNEDFLDLPLLHDCECTVTV